MALDVSALPVTGQTVKYAKAAWDFDRDGGTVGAILSIPSQQLPVGAVVIAIGHQTVDPIVDIGTTAFDVYAGGINLDASLSPALASASFISLNAYCQVITAGSMPITIGVAGDGFSAGSAYIYVFYI
jgi:hypothetical protein